MTKWILAMLLLSSQVYAELCPVDCNGQKPVNAFDFWKKAQQAGDPNTGGALGTTIKVPSQDGGEPDTDVSTKDYFDQINDFENWSAKECGQSLNQDGDVLVAAPCNNVAMNRRKKSIVVGAHSPTGSPIPTVAVINQYFEAAKSPAAQQAQLKSIWRRDDGVALNHKNCFPAMGFETPGKDLFAVYALGEFCAELSASKIANNNPVMLGAPLDARARVSGGGKAGVFVFNKDLNIIRVTAEMNSPYQKDSSRNTYGYFLGQVVHKDTVTGKDLNYNYTFNAGSLKKGASTTFTIGPVPITVEAGAEGKVGIVFLTRQTGFWANGHVVPFLDTTAYAAGYVNAVIAQAGVEAKLSPLFRDALDLYGLAAMASYQVDAGNGQKYLSFIASTQVDLLNEVTALSGQVNLFLKIIRPKFIGWKWKKYVMNLFSWEGVYAKGYIFSKDNLAVPVYNLK